MFGSIFRMKPKPGQEDAVIAYGEKWSEERQPLVKGAVALYTFRRVENPRELTGIAIFDSRDSYFANANDPEQDRWYRELVELLEEPPAFDDGEVIFSWTAAAGAEVAGRGL